MTTKPDTDTGWSKATPEYDGYYWWRLDKDGDADPCQVREGRVYDFGDRDSVPLDGLGGDWLGPISPSNFEQLIRLRQIAQDALQFRILMNGPCGHEGYMTKLCTQCEIREALAHTGEQS